MKDADDLSELREEFPAWRFGSAWVTAASGPDQRRLWASNGDTFLSNWSAAGLRAAISAAVSTAPESLDAWDNDQGNLWSGE